VTNAEDLKELLERNERKIEELEEELERMKDEIDKNALYIQNGWSQ